MNHIELREFIDRYFDENELRDLSFDLTIDYESLPAVGKSAKIRELIAYCQRHERFEELEAHVRELRAGAPSLQPPVATETRPLWNLVHPYGMPPNFTGRLEERTLLTQWLTNDAPYPLLVIHALGGFGKSALAWHWLLNDVNAAQWPRVVWWSFYEGDASFENFVRETLTYFYINPASLGPRQQVDKLLKFLQPPGTLLILDGFERQLRAFSSLNAAYQGDETPSLATESRERVGEGTNTNPHPNPLPNKGEGAERDCISPLAEHFLRSLASLPNLRSKVLMTTRLCPRILQTRSGELLQGCREKELTQMEPADAVTFFRAQGVRGTRAEIEAACAPYGYHPLSLRLLAGLILNDLQQPSDIAMAKRLDVSGDLVARQHHVLEQAYNSLIPARQKLLSRIACFRSAVSYEALHALEETSEGFEGPRNKVKETKISESFDTDLHDLLARGLLHRDEHNHFDLHPIVRRYAYDRLTGQARAAAHTQLRNYFAAVPTPIKMQMLDDLQPVIELYHHTVRAGQYDEACALMSDRLIPYPLYFQFGAYQLCIELLRALFPGGEDQPPWLKEKSDQAWTLNALANSYSLSGRPRHAIPMVERYIAISEKRGDKINISIGLGNVADDQLKIGAFRAAEGSLRHRIDLCDKLEDEFRAAIGHQEMGRLLAYRGLWVESDHELAIALGMFEKQRNVQGQGVTWAYRVLRVILMARTLPPPVERTMLDRRGIGDEGLAAAHRAVELADETARTTSPVERDYVRAHWLLGAASRLNGDLAQADHHLSEALTRCRNINVIADEADILLDLAHLQVDQGEREEALRLAQEALLITERSEYVLQGADVHLLMAQLVLDAGDKRAALLHAREARRLATCDGPPDYTYKVAYDEAGALLEQLGEN